MIALAVSMVSARFAVWFGSRDRSWIKTDSQLLQAYPTENEDPLGPSTLRVQIANRSRCRLGKADRYEHFSVPDTDCILTNNDGSKMTNLYFEDSLNNQYYVKGAKKNIDAYFAAIEEQ